MFSRKKRSQSNPPARRYQQQQPPNVSTAASVAATAAFLGSQPSRNNSLSSAAAAAALRSATTSPVPVGDIRTKRMVRRDSNSSLVSAGGGSQRQPFSSGLQRRGSSSSMADRSFRSPSPGRTNRAPEVPSEPVPPVPNIPLRSARRTSSSSDMPSPRLDTSATSGSTTEVNGKKRAPRPASVLSNGSYGGGQDSPTSPRNINFSRPMSPGPGPSITSPRGAAPFHTGPQVNVQARPASTLGFAHDRDRAASQSNSAAATAARASAANAKPAATGPTPEQIRAYQSRAASLLARPRSEVYQPPPPAPSSKLNRTSSLLNPNTTTTATQPQQRKSQAQPPRPSSAASHSRGNSQPTNKRPASSASISRSLSVSPARSAHFSDTPVVEGIKHQPSLRAISPYKSALKSPSRPQSPALKPPGSVVGSESGSVLSDDGSGTVRRKSARVSFDERPIMVGESAAGLPAGSSNQRSTGFKDDEYTGMGGAPVLPSFGSVRGSKSADEPTASGIHNTADTVFKEPTEKEAIAPISGAPVIAVQPATPLPDESARKELESPRSSGEIEPGRPSLEEMMSAEGVTDVAKSRPIDSPPSSPSRATFQTAGGALGVSGAPAAATTEEPRLSSDYDGEDSDIDGDQEYSDAAEDQSELDERGAFASLDAIMESPQAEISEEPPVSPSTPRTTFKQAAAYEPAAQPNTASPAGVALGSAGPQSTEDEDWDKVRAYWSGLSEQSKQQIEAAATPLPAKDGAAGANGGSKAALKKKKDGTAKDPSAALPLPPWPDKEYQEHSTSPRQSGKASAATQQAKQQSREGARSPMRSSLRGADRPVAKAAQPAAPRPKAEKPQPLGTVTPSPATAQAIAQAIAARQGKSSLQRTDSVGSDSSFKKTRKAKTGEQKYTMRSTMRRQEPNGKPPAAAKPQSRPMSPDAHPRPAMRTSMRRNSVSSMESTQSTSRFSLFGRSSSKSRAPASKPAKSTKKSGASKFSSRFNDSDSDGDDVGYPAFRSRFVDSDDSDDDADTRASTFAPVRGIPRKNGQMPGDSTDLDDSEGEAPGTKTNTVINGTSAPDAETTTTKTAGQELSEGTALTAGTLRDSKPAEKRKSKGLFGFGRKKKTTETGSEVGSVPNSPMAATAAGLEDTAPSSPMEGRGRPITPPSAIGLANGHVSETPGSVQTLASPTPGSVQSPVSTRKDVRKRSSSRASSIFRRWSMSAPTSPNETAGQNGEFPGFGSTPAVPAIPDEYKLSPAPAGSTNPRPITSDGVGLAAGLTRPPLGSKRDSTMTAPESGVEKKVVYSMRTGKKKKFQGLRRRLGIED